MRISDWSSDVCSSDLENVVGNVRRRPRTAPGIVVLDRAERRTHLAVDIGYAEIDTVEETAVMVILAAQLHLIDPVAEKGVAEGAAGRRDQRRVERVDARIHVIGDDRQVVFEIDPLVRSEEHTSELQSLMRISYAVFCLKKKTNKKTTKNQ